MTILSKWNFYKIELYTQFVNIFYTVSNFQILSKNSIWNQLQSFKWSFYANCKWLYAM